jgi:transposase
MKGRALTTPEINERLIRLRNVEHLYSLAKTRIGVLENQVQELKEENRLLREENVLLKTKLDDLGYQFEQMKAIVFGKKSVAKKILDDDETPKPPVSRSKDSYKRPIPKDSEVTQTIEHRLPPNASSRVRTKMFYVEDIPLDTKKTVTKHIVHQYHDGVSWIGEISLPYCSVTLGENIRMLVTTLTVEQRLSQDQVLNLVQLLYGIHISVGELNSILDTEALLLTPAYESLIDSIRLAPYSHMDETGWKILGEGGHAWSITDDKNRSAYILGVSRGKGIAEQLRGDSENVLISDDYGVYAHLAGHHQLCWAHLIRHFRDLAQSGEFIDEAHESLKKVYQEVKAVHTLLKSSLATENPEHQRQQFTEQLQNIATIHEADPPALIRIKTTLNKNISKYLTCLQFPTIPLTNNTAERSLRSLVIKRRISFGSRSHQGARALSVLFTVVKELLRSHLDDYFEAYRRVRV